jgi:mRNA interferase HigB
LRIISRKRLREFWEKHPDAKEPLSVWYSITRRAQWDSLADTKKEFPHADLVGICTVFNIKGNSYRLITKIYYRHKKVFIRYVMTHGEYDKGAWKDDCNC